MKKRLTAYLISTAIILACLCPVAMAASYSDISGHWAQTAIRTYSGYKILEGDTDGRFRPDDSISRAELATVLNRLFRYSSAAENTFEDLPDDAWYTEAVLKVNKAGIMLGDGEYIYPAKKVTRQEAALMIARAFTLKTTSELPSYPDKADIDSWAVDAVAAMSSAGYMQGSTDGYFHPKSPLTRAQAVTILDNIIERVYEHGDILTRDGRLRYLSMWYDVFENVPVNTYFDTGIFAANNGVTSYTSNGKYALLGIDVSFWQGEIDWQRVANSGIGFAMIRLGYRTAADGELFLDEQFEKNISGALANGIDVGVYFFSQAIDEDEAVEEAEFVLANLSAWNITYPVVFDWENVPSVENARTSDMSKPMLNRCAIAFCDRILAAGYEAMIYTNKWFGMNNYDLSLLTGYDLWFAGYGTDYPTLYYRMDMWQFTSSGRVDGIAGSVDMNLSFVDYPGGVPRFS